MARGRSPSWDEPRGDSPDQHVGGLLHQLRQLHGVSQREVAEGLGVDPSYISRVERGQRPAPDRIIRYYAERFGDEGLLRSYVDIARVTKAEQEAVWDPELEARRAAYPLPGDESTFLSEDPPDGIAVALGEVFTKSWTIRNSGTVPWIGRRLMRRGPTTGPWTLTSEKFTAIPDTLPGEEVTISVPIKACSVPTAAVAQWKMVDEEGLLCFPDRYSTGVGLFVLVGHGAVDSAH